MDVQKHIDYWRNGSEEDIAAARSLLNNKHFRHALFCAHLAIEKMLKAHVTRRTKDVPPRIHNLVRLAELGGLTLPLEREEFLEKFGIFQLEGRYPDALQADLDLQLTQERLRAAEEMLLWLRTQL